MAWRWDINGPELYNREDYDEKADIWALGCLQYEMCTNQTGFDL